MRKALSPALLIAAFAITLGWILYALLARDSADLVNYKRVQVGMSVEEVQAILGPGSVISQAEVPGVVRAVNAADVDSANERTRRAGNVVPTARDYPTAVRPVVEGDFILKWVDTKTGERILVGFKNGKVFEKDYWDPNYL